MTIPARQMSLVLAATIGAAILLFFQAGAWGQPGQSLPLDREAGKTYVAGELIVSYEPGTPDALEAEAAGVRGARVAERLEGLNAEVLTFPDIKDDRPGEAREEALRRIKENLEEIPGVAAVDYNYVREFFFIPNDPSFGEQWGFQKPGFPSAWDRTRGRGVKVAVVDSGIAAGHPDFEGKIFAQRDFVNEDGRAEDDVGHGTHVAGTMAAATNNGTGVAGGCPGCKLLVAKVGDWFGITDRDLVQGIKWSADNGAEAINISIGGTKRSAVLKNAVDYAYGKGAVIVAAAGNNGKNVTNYPAAYSNVIAVAATNKRDKRASFSNYGKWVDVAAPGVDILSTIPGGYAYDKGTSMASPHVTALAGLLAAQGRGKVEIRRRIIRTAVDLGPDGRDPYYGSGRIRAARAVQ